MSISAITAAKSSIIISGLVLAILFASIQQVWAADQSPAPHNTRWMWLHCVQDKDGTVRSKSKVKKCCTQQQKNCWVACDDLADREDCYRRCNAAKNRCFKNADDMLKGDIPGDTLKFQTQPQQKVAPAD